MTPLIPDVLESSYDDLSVNDLIVTMDRHADKAEEHVAFKENVPEYVTRSERLRQIARGLEVLRDAIDGGDRNKIPEKKALIAEGTRALALNATHITLLSQHRKDPSILLNAGYELKQKTTVKGMVNLVDLVPDVYVKHGAVSGAINILVKRAKQHASIELQMTCQDPTVEASWPSPGMIYNRSRIESRGLTPASTVHVRARYHQDGGTGRWSSVVSIIVL